jgi:nucleotide-binding universal stress UspA family protein
MERVELFETDKLASDVESEEFSDYPEEDRFIGKEDHGYRSVDKASARQDKIREIIVPVMDAANDGKMLRYACELARLFSARIALVYSVPQVTLSEDILEYSRIENYKDFVPDHMQSSGEIALSKISNRLKKEGVEFRQIISCSDEKRIINELLNGSSTETMAVVIRSGEKNYGFANLGFLKSLTAEVILKSKVPVFVIP